MRMNRDHHLNLADLSEEECEDILKVIQRDFNLRQQEKQRLCKITEEVAREGERTTVLAEQKTFNANCCMRCYSRFFFLFNQRIPCLYCSYNICKQCCDYDPESKHYICKVCQKQRELKLQSCEWFYSNVLQKFKRFGSAKVVRSIYKRRTESDSENDSGYDPASRSNSLPNGRKRSRQSLQGLFGLDSKAGTDGSSEKCDVIVEENERNGSALAYNTPYTCSVSTGRANFDEVKDTELYRLHAQLADVALSLRQTLENQSPDGAINNSGHDTYEKMLDKHRLHITSQLSSIQQTLHIAVDNQAPTSSTEQTQTAKHELIRQIVSKDVQQFLGNSQNELSLKSEFDETNDNYEEVLAAMIVDRIVCECRRKQSEQAAVEETDTRRSLTHLSNHATAEQLSEMLSESSEAEASTPSQHEDIELVCRKEMLQSVESGVYTDDGGMNATDSNEEEEDGEDELDELVRRNLPDHVVSSDSDVFNVVRQHQRHRDAEHNGDGTDSDDTTLADRCYDDDVSDDDEILGAHHIRNHHVPLPSFEGDSLDDITSSCHDDDDDDDEIDDAEIDDADNWCLSPVSSGLFDNISAYDNLGKKKLGKDEEDGSTVLMFIPGSMNSPRVGNREIDDLSDLSENDTKSGDESDAAAEDIFNKPVMADSSIQTEDHRSIVSVSIGPDQEEESGHPEVMPEISTEAEEVDPKFMKRPHNVKCAEGEMIRLECEVTGTEPVDIFWYKEMTEIQQLEDDERCNITVDAGRCVVEMFNLTKSDTGQYLCIGVNEVGKCSQSIQLVVEDNSEEFQSPEMLKGLLDLETSVGQRAKFKCKVAGYPIPLVVWYKDHKRIKPSEKYNVQKIGNRDYMLTIDDLTWQDDCEIRVVARNIAGEAKSRAQLIITDTDPEDRIKVTRKSDEPSETTKHAYEHLYPETSELLQLAQQVSATRGQVNDTAEDMLNSANELSSIHHHLDEMDHQLQSMETDISPSGRFVCDDDEDDANNNETEDEEMTLAANSIQQLTHKALDILSSAEHVVESERKTHGMKRKSESPTAELEDVQPSGRQRNARFFSDSATSHILNMSDVFPDMVDCGLHQIDSNRYGRDFVINDGSPSRGSWTWQQRRTKSLEVPSGCEAEIIKREERTWGSGDVRTSDGEEREHGQQEQAGESNCIYDSRLSESSSVEAEVKVYMAAGNTYSLEERIMQLEGRVQSTHKDTSCQQMDALEHEVSQTAAHVQHSARQVAAVESSVQREIDNNNNTNNNYTIIAQSSPTGEDYPLNRNPDETPCTLQGDMNEVNSSRTEIDGELTMPSVRSLIDKYAANSPGDATVKRVCSLTERSLPRTVREKLKQGYPIANANVRGVSPSVDSNRNRRRLEDLFSEDESMSDSVDMTDDANSTKAEKRVLKLSTAAVELRNSDGPEPVGGSTGSNEVLTTSYVSKAVLKSPSYDNNTPEDDHFYTIAENDTTAPLSPRRLSPVVKHGQSSTIMARAAFWDTRIIQGEVSDSNTSVEFPTMPEESFKGEDEIF